MNHQQSRGNLNDSAKQAEGTHTARKENDRQLHEVAQTIPVPAEHQQQTSGSWVAVKQIKNGQKMGIQNNGPPETTFQQQNSLGANLKKETQLLDECALKIKTRQRFMRDPRPSSLENLTPNRKQSSTVNNFHKGFNESEGKNGQAAMTERCKRSMNSAQRTRFVGQSEKNKDQSREEQKEDDTYLVQNLMHVMNQQQRQECAIDFNPSAPHSVALSASGLDTGQPNSPKDPNSPTVQENASNRSEPGIPDYISLKGNRRSILDLQRSSAAHDAPEPIPELVGQANDPNLSAQASEEERQQRHEHTESSLEQSIKSIHSLLDHQVIGSVHHETDPRESGDIGSAEVREESNHQRQQAGPQDKFNIQSSNLLDEGKSKSPIQINGEVEDIDNAIWSLSESNPDGGISCTYYNYTTLEEVPNVVVKLSRNSKQLLIMSRGVATKKKNQTRSCLSYFGCSKASSDRLNLRINLKDLSGHLLGPRSETFCKVAQKESRINEDNEVWKYISLYASNNTTYDLEIGRQDANSPEQAPQNDTSIRAAAINFIVAVSQSALNQNPDFWGYTNKDTISKIFFRYEIEQACRTIRGKDVALQNQNEQNTLQSQNTGQAHSEILEELKKTEEQLKQEKIIKIVQTTKKHRNIKQIIHSDNDEPEELQLGLKKATKTRQTRSATFHHSQKSIRHFQRLRLSEKYGFLIQWLKQNSMNSIFICQEHRANDKHRTCAKCRQIRIMDLQSHQYVKNKMFLTCTLYRLGLMAHIDQIRRTRRANGLRLDTNHKEKLVDILWRHHYKEMRQVNVRLIDISKEKKQRLWQRLDNLADYYMSLINLSTNEWTSEDFYNQILFQVKQEAEKNLQQLDEEDSLQAEQFLSSINSSIKSTRLSLQKSTTFISKRTDEEPVVQSRSRERRRTVHHQVSLTSELLMQQQID